MKDAKQLTASKEMRLRVTIIESGGGEEEAKVTELGMQAGEGVNGSLPAVLSPLQ